MTRQRKEAGTRAFVAMWFDDSLDDAWSNGFELGVLGAGYQAYRLKEDIHADRIDARIIAAIRAARFVVADVTGERNAVYYEAGFVDGFGKPSSGVVAHDRMGDVCFDTRQFRHIVWNDPQDLRGQLTSTIQAIIV